MLCSHYTWFKADQQCCCVLWKHLLRKCLYCCSRPVHPSLLLSVWLGSIFSNSTWPSVISCFHVRRFIQMFSYIKLGHKKPKKIKWTIFFFPFFFILQTLFVRVKSNISIISLAVVQMDQLLVQPSNNQLSLTVRGNVPRYKSMLLNVLIRAMNLWLYKSCPWYHITQNNYHLPKIIIFTACLPHSRHSSFLSSSVECWWLVSHGCPVWVFRSSSALRVSSPREALCSVLFFRTAENILSQCALLWSMVNILHIKTASSLSYTYNNNIQNLYSALYNL